MALDPSTLLLALNPQTLAGCLAANFPALEPQNQTKTQFIRRPRRSLGLGSTLGSSDFYVEGEGGGRRSPMWSLEGFEGSQVRSRPRLARTLP